MLQMKTLLNYIIYLIIWINENKTQAKLLLPDKGKGLESNFLSLKSCYSLPHYHHKSPAIELG